MLPEDLKLVSLSDHDVDDALTLSKEVKWNQSAEDWMMMIRQGKAFGLKTTKKPSQLVATAVILPFGKKFAWISMVIVTASRRKRGLSAYLLKICIQHVKEMQCIPVLDATPEGAKVYAKLGFTPVGQFRRMCAKRVSIAHCSPSPAVKQATDSDLKAMAYYDKENTKLDRPYVLAYLLHTNRQYAFITSGKAKGFILARKGTEALQIGPLIAGNMQLATALMNQVLSVARSHPVFIDVSETHTSFIAYLEAYGFSTQRYFQRMVLGDDPPPAQTSRIFAIAGPELG